MRYLITTASCTAMNFGKLFCTALKGYKGEVIQIKSLNKMKKKQICLNIKIQFKTYKTVYKNIGIRK